MAASAYQFQIDDFTVSKNDSTTSFSGAILHDSFSDGVLPPNPNFFGLGLPDYSLVGVMGPEAGGKLMLDGSLGAITHDPKGNGFISQIATVLTNTDNTDFTKGLKSDDTFSVNGIFDLVVPMGNGEGYGVRLTDRTSLNAGNDQIQLFVIRDFGGQVHITLNEQSFIDGTSVNLASTFLDSSHDQIALRLSRNSLSSNLVTASFAYGDAGILGDYNDLGAQATIFDGEAYTRAGFMAFGFIPAAPVPEPETYAMLFAGLGLLGFAVRRKGSARGRS
jgi:hypothetical protein